MRKINDVVRLHFDCGQGQRPIGRCLGLSRTTVGDYLRRANAAGLGWPLPEALTDQQLYSQLFPSASPVPVVDRTVPDCAYLLHTELKRKGVTLMLLWEEYQAEHPQGLPLQPFL